MPAAQRKGTARKIQDYTIRPKKKKPTLSLRGIEKERNVLEARYRRLKGNQAESLLLSDVHAGTVQDDREWVSEDEDDQMAAGVMDGSSTLEASHGGGELGLLIQRALQKLKPKPDTRNRRNRVERRNRAFAAQIPWMVGAFLHWQFHTRVGAEEVPTTPPKDASTKVYTVFDVFHAFFTFNTARLLKQGVGSYTVVLPNNETVSSLIRRGFIPSAPKRPSFLVAIPALQLYHAVQLRCPHLSVQPFVKALCDLHGSEYRSTVCEQFIICYDAFLAAKDGVRHQALAAVGRADPDWRLKNACPCCCYKLEGENKLKFEMLITMDGNNSLKRILRRDPNGGEHAAPVERLDTRDVGNGYYLPVSAVDRFVKDKGKGKGEGSEGKEGNGPEKEKEGSKSVVAAESVANGCSERWKNLNEGITSKMWSVFDETGIFTSLCRHGFTLVLADMLRSGELSKYPLAVLQKLLTVYGPGVAGGYDIGCGFNTTIRQSLIAALADSLGYRSLVGAFHGHAHNRLCQIDNLATYVEGLGLEDLEGAERFFSKSNALASSTCYSSRFHRQQKIVQFIKGHDNFDVYPNLSKFLVNNYKQALEILAGVDEFKRDCLGQGINNPSVFPTWLLEEKKYITSLKREPEEEGLKIEYLEKLIKYYEYDNKLSPDENNWVNVTAPQSYEETRADTAHRERLRRQNAELRTHALTAVHELENKLLILPINRWRQGSEEWNKTDELLRKRTYQRCLDQLESLVVARLFEMGKMNLPQTGYNLRQHISKAIKTHSQAIRTALDKYNTAASRLKPPKQKLDWDEITEYTFVSEFDLLRDSREDIREKEWAKPAARRLMDQYFKLIRAREEIDRLNVEVRRLVTHIADEERYLELTAAVLKGTNPTLGYEVMLYAQERGRANQTHLKRLHKLSLLEGFTGTLEVGIAKGGLSPWLREPVSSIEPSQSTNENSSSKQPFGKEGDGANQMLCDGQNDAGLDADADGGGGDNGAGDAEEEADDDQEDEEGDDGGLLSWLTDALIKSTLGEAAEGEYDAESGCMQHEKDDAELV